MFDDNGQKTMEMIFVDGETKSITQYWDGEVISHTEY
jgi:hypothetical protein